MGSYAQTITVTKLFDQYGNAADLLTENYAADATGAFQPTTTLTVFNWNAPADGVTQNVGAAKVAFRIEISPLQAAANDYQNNLIYVATPVF